MERGLLPVRHKGTAPLPFLQVAPSAESDAMLFISGSCQIFISCGSCSTMFLEFSIFSPLSFLIIYFKVQFFP
jgi:hypothetical protein